MELLFTRLTVDKHNTILNLKASGHFCHLLFPVNNNSKSLYYFGKIPKGALSGPSGEGAD